MATTTGTTRTTPTELYARGGTYEGVSPPFTLSELYCAYLQCKKHKSNSKSHLVFEQNLEENLIHLRDSLNDGSWNISQATVFVAMHPKPREIWASDFTDRIVHHLLITPLERIYENPHFSHHFLSQVYSCRKNKGTHKAVLDAKTQLQTYKYVLQLDIKHFFTSINKELLCEILTDELDEVDFHQKERIIGLLHTIIRHSYSSHCFVQKRNFEKIPREKSLFQTEKKGCGLPIGNLTSQFLANVYLNKLDKFIVQTLGCSSYIRYVDDLTLFANDESQLHFFHREIHSFLQTQLQQSLQEAKTTFGLCKNGIDYLGYFIKPTHTLVRKRVVNIAKEKIAKKRNILLQNPTRENQKDLLCTMNSYFGHFRLANAHRLEQRFSQKVFPYLLPKKQMGRITMTLQHKQPFLSSIEQYRHFATTYKNHIILFQNGTFYRLYGVQAQIVSQLVGIKLMRSKNGKYHCGFPIDAKKVSELEQLGFSCAFVTQTPQKLITGIQERVVSKVITAKPFIESDFQTERLQDVLTWDLTQMTPVEVLTRLERIIIMEKKK